MNPQQQVALDFLMMIFRRLPGDQFVQLALIHPSDREKRIQVRTMPRCDLPSALKKASLANTIGYGVYFRVCPVGRRLPDNRRGGVGASTSIPALWLDMDSVKGGALPSADAVRLMQLSVAPSAILLSGSGVHAYWLLQTPLALSDENRQTITGLLRGLARTLGGDPSVAELSRLMRVPGFTNTKPEAGGRRVTLLDVHPERRYALDALHELGVYPAFESACQPDQMRSNQPSMPPKPGSMPAWAEAFLLNGDGGRYGGRNNTAYRIACHLFGRGADAASVRDIVGSAARRSGLDDPEIEHLLRSAQRRIQNNTHP